MFWILPNDLLLIPQFAGLGFFLHVFTITAFLVFLFVCLFGDKQRYYSSMMIGVSTFLAWYVGTGLLNFAFPIIILHAAPYFVLVYRYGVKTLSNDGPWPLRQMFASSIGFLFFYSLLVLAALVGRTPDWSTLTIIPVSVALFHYTTDAIVWRISRPDNKAVVEVLSRDKAA